MLQAFVSLKPQQPARTESGMRSFFESLQNAVFSRPTVFCSNTDPTPRQYTIDAVVEAALNPRCKFVVLRADSEKFWQCTFLLPDIQGVGALHFDLQRTSAPRRISAVSLMTMFKSLYESLRPKLVRVGDSEAREKLKSRHGLAMMPGLGRIEWLQIVSPEVYSDIYNPSDLVAAPAFQTEVWEDGALFLRVYDDPNDWESEDNESLANFIPGFLAGIAKIKDGEKEKESIRELERLCNRAEKTAEKAYAVLEAAPAAAPASEPVAPAPAAPVAEPVPAAAPAAADLSDEVLSMRSAIFTRLQAEDYKVDEDNIVKTGVEGICTLFKVKLNNHKPDMFVSYQDDERKVLILNSLDDFSRFLKINGCSVKDDCVEKCAHLIGSYFHPENQLLKSLDELPENVRNDRRVPDFRSKFVYGKATIDADDNRELIFWVYQPEIQGVENIILSQYQEWPIQVESKVLCADMENEPEPVAPAQPAKEASVIEELSSDGSDSVEKKADSDELKVDFNNVKLPPAKASISAATSSAPAKKSSSTSLLIAVLVLVVIIVVGVILMSLGIISF